MHINNVKVVSVAKVAQLEIDKCDPAQKEGVIIAGVLVSKNSWGGFNGLARNSLKRKTTASGSLQLQVELSHRRRKGDICGEIAEFYLV